MTLHCTLDGRREGPVLVLSSSLGTTGDMWTPQLPMLEGEWRIVRVDHPGHGGSPLGEQQVTVESIGRSVLDLLDGLGYPRFSFCGLSLGGMVGQWLAAHAPERMDRLILCSTSARLPGETYMQRAVTVREQGVAAVVDAVLERWFTPRFRSRHAEVVERFRRMVESVPAAGYAACAEAVGRFDGRGDLGAIRAPTLVIVGDSDPVASVEHARFLRDAIAGARLIVVEEAAHMVNVEQPKVVGDAMRLHLNGDRE